MPRGAQNTPTGAGERARRRQLPGELVYSGLAFAENLPDSAPPHGAPREKDSVKRLLSAQGTRTRTTIEPDRKARMTRAIGDLERLSDSPLFKELSEGMPLIVDNAVSLDETAHRLYREKEFRASEIMQGFAEEEAAKFLILIDFVRCPRDSDRRAQVLKRFYDHVEKRVYAMTSSYPRIASFRELSELVDSECRLQPQSRSERLRYSDEDKNMSAKCKEVLDDLCFQLMPPPPLLARFPAPASTHPIPQC